MLLRKGLADWRGHFRFHRLLFDDLDHLTRPRFDDNAAIVHDRVAVLLIFRHRPNFDSCGQRLTDDHAFFDRDRWKLLVLNIGHDLARRFGRGTYRAANTGTDHGTNWTADCATNYRAANSAAHGRCLGKRKCR
jgi:hypothetical protein